MKFSQLALVSLMLCAGASFAADAPKASASASASAAAAAAPSGSCADRAVDKNGKALAGAAKNSFMKKCEADSKPAGNGCAAKAIDKNGKALAGAAKNSFMKKCEADAGKK